jgi:Rps23 Pro-64 3,4-dihydroxylase Tpa1-like proline 4-hydroxylase
LDDLEKQLGAAHAESASLQAHIKEIKSSISWKLTAPVRFIGRHLLKIARAIRLKRIINLDQIRNHRLETDPYQWAAIENLYSPADAAKLAATFPCDHFKLVASYGGEKDYEYEARALIGMGADAISYPEQLSDSWRALARDLLSPAYRSAMSALTGCDLTHAPMEVNVFHYGPGASLGPHPDLPDKIVTHVLYFNRSWNPADGGCLSILRSANPADVAAEIVPIVGNSVVIVRADNSWHAVSRVVSDSASSRRSVTVTFYRPGSISTMWPPNERAALHRYHAPDLP